MQSLSCAARSVDRWAVPCRRTARLTGTLADVSLNQQYRMRNPRTGREVIVEAEPDKIYRDRETGDVLEVVAKLVPLPPSPSRLPFAVEHLRFCNWCNQLAQRDLNDCPTCGRRMEPLQGAPSPDPVA